MVELGKSDLESMFVTLRVSEFFENLSKLGNVSLISFTDPSLNNIDGAPFRESKPENPASEIILF